MWWYHCIVMGLPFMLPSLNSSPFNAKKCSWAPKKPIFKRSYIDFYCGEEITLSSSSYFSEYLKLESKRVPALQTPCCSSTGKWETHIVAREVDESYISYAEPFTVDHKLPSLPLRPMKSCLKLVFRQAPRLLQLPIGTQSHRAVALDWPGDKERLCVCVCQSHTHAVEALVHLYHFVSLCLCEPAGETRPSAPVFILKDKLNPQSTFIKTGSEKVVICLSKYKHGRNNERSFISFVNPGLLMALQGFACLDRWASEEMTAGVLFPALCRGTICRMR